MLKKKRFDELLYRWKRMNFHIKLTKIIKERNHFNVSTYFLDINPHSIFFFKDENVKKQLLYATTILLLTKGTSKLVDSDKFF